MGVNRLTEEEIQLLVQGVNPLEGCGLPPPERKFRCDSCASKQDRRRIRPAKIVPAECFIIFGDIILEGRCTYHVMDSHTVVPYELGANFLWWKLTLSDILAQ